MTSNDQNDQNDFRRSTQAVVRSDRRRGDVVPLVMIAAVYVVTCVAVLMLMLMLWPRDSQVEAPFQQPEACGPSVVG